MLYGRGIFDKIRNWTVKIRNISNSVSHFTKSIKITCFEQKTAKWEKVNLVTRGIWKNAGVPDKALDKWKYLKR